jgi:hypothetical protein
MARLDVIKRGGELCRLTSDDGNDDDDEQQNTTEHHRHAADGEGARLRFLPQVLLVRTQERGWMDVYRDSH